MIETLKLPDIREVGDLKGKRVLVRTDFNVPVVNGKIVNDFRMRESFETILYLRDKEAKIILVSHRAGVKDSLSDVATYLKEHIQSLFFESLNQNEIKEFVEGMKDGDIVLLENLRMHKGEKENNNDFAMFLASLAEIYVNEAFSTSHREHASVVGVPKYLPHYAGILFQREVEGLSSALVPESPSLFILGGAKFETKEPLIRRFLKTYDRIFVGGALAHDFLKAKGLNVGKSLVSDYPDINGLLENKKIILPKDVVVRRAHDVKTVIVEDVLDGDVIDDIGIGTIEGLKDTIQDAAFILWNGTMGNYEDNFNEATKELAKVIAESTALSIVGGGDTVASIQGLGLERKFTFLSTGGGAMVEYLSVGTLPGIEALRV